MKRNLKILGLAVVAAMVLSAVIASAASAQNGRLTSDGPITLIGTQTGEPSANAISAFGGEIRCPNATYTGHKYSATPHELLLSGEETNTTTPHYGVCTGLGFPATVDMNGCDYVQHLEGTTGADKYAVKITIVCPEGKHITITMFGSAAKHTENKPFCHLTITENLAGYTGLEATDTTDGTQDLIGTMANFTIDEKSPTGSILCPEQSTSTASLKVNVTGVGRNAAGESTSLSLSHV